jgi:hypothetical protein
MNTIFNPNASIRGQLFRKVDEWQKIIDSGKKLGFIWGTDKPRVNMINGKYCFQFIDIVDNAVNPWWQMSARPGEFHEFFYWSPDLPEIMIKQGHVIKKYLELSTPTSMYMCSESSGLGFAVHDGVKSWITTLGVNSLIYPKYNFNLLNEFKPKSLFWSPRDNWFFKMNNNDLAYKNWAMSLDNLWKSVPYYWKNNPAEPTKAFKGMYSKPYFME